MVRDINADAFRCATPAERALPSEEPARATARVTALQVQCCIAGAGPAGLTLGLLLARAGVEVAVLEKHSDFLRDFRGDTIHPSTLEVMHELGLLDAFLQRPHQRVTRLAGRLGDSTIAIADFSHLPTRCKFLAFMPQWDFLSFLAERASRYPHFRLLLQAKVSQLAFDGERVAGVRADTPEGPLEVRAPLTVACDGRESVVRAQAGLEVEEIGAPMDVLWLRFHKHSGDPQETFGYVREERILALIDRGEFWQCAFVIPKGALEKIEARGLDDFRAQIARTAPFLGDRVGDLRSWDEVKLLTVRVNRLRRWYREGLLCVGDAAHAMSPIGGVGVNLAIQDAVAAANLLARKLREGCVSATDLRAVQRRRAFAAAATQAIQVFVQRHVIGRVLADGRSPFLGAVVWLARRLPLLQRIPGYLVGLGLRPEHVAAPTAPAGGAHGAR
jgi:2-polyprenyl-6-methoxyphenol hydroxylase-like FAD-dependent oxidoreductase